MILDFINMSGYGVYIWLSYGLVTLFCLVLYIRISKTLKKYEKEFKNELLKFNVQDRAKLAKSSKVAKHILSTLEKTI